MKKRNIVRAGLLLGVLAAVAVWLISCGGGGSSMSVPATTTQPTTQPPQNNGTPITLTGRVTDMDDNPIAGASVTVSGNSQTFTAGADGGFSASVSLNSSGETVVQLAAARGGYVTAFETVRLQSDDASGSATLRMSREPAAADQGTQALVTRSDGSTEAVTPVVTTASDSGLAVAVTTVNITAQDRAVTFSAPQAGAAPPSVAFSIGDASGAGANAAAVLGATGAITGSVTYGSPDDAEDLEMFPGEFLTTSDTGSGGGEGVLITAGFARISLTDAAGAPITQFQPGTTAQITMRVPASAQNPETGAPVAAGDTIPVFIYNESTGAWIVEHNDDNSIKRATVQSDADGLFVNFTTTHLTWFNLDWKSTLCPSNKPVVHIKDNLGNPVLNAEVTVQVPGWYTPPLYTTDGTVTFDRAPANVDWTVTAYASGSTLISNTVSFSNCLDTVTGLDEADLVLQQTCTTNCAVNSDCDDSDPNTTDTCDPYGVCMICNNIPCDVRCSTDAHCEDGDLSTINTCVNPGTCAASCTNQCVQACRYDYNCNDTNAFTWDICNNPGTCTAACSNPPCTHECAADTDCADGNPNTADVCFNPATCTADCYNNEPWVEMGAGSATTGISSGDASMQSMVLDSTGSPVVAWLEMETGGVVGHILTKRWNGSAWVEMGVGSAAGYGIVTNTQVVDFEMAANGSGDISIVWQEYSENRTGNVYVKKWNGSTWEYLATGAETVSSFGFQPDIAVDSMGRPVVVWIEGQASLSNTGIYIERWNGISWEEVGTGSATGNGFLGVYGGSGFNPAVVVDLMDYPIVTWTNGTMNINNRYVIYVKRWNGTAWAEIGLGSASGEGISTGNSTFPIMLVEYMKPKIFVKSTGYPVIAWNASAYMNYFVQDLYIKEWDGTSWVEMGAGSGSGSGLTSVSPDVSFSPISNISLAESTSGNLFVAWDSSSKETSAYDAMNQAYILEWNGSVWTEPTAGSSRYYGVFGSSMISSSYPEIVFDGSGNLVISTGGNDRVRVLKKP